MTLTFFGDRHHFAIGFELLADPDTGEQRPDRVGSWGALQLWVGSRNLTAGVTRTGHEVHSVECPLLPVVAWVAKNWDVLFHQSRLPRAGAYATSALWHSRSLDAADTDDAVMDARFEWWREHGLGAALPDYRIPDLHIRRMDDDVELSWDDSEWRSVPSGIILSEHRGAALIEAARVGHLLHEWCSAVVVACRKIPQCNAGFLDTLEETLQGLSAPARALQRLQLVAGMPSLERAARRMLEFAGIPDGDVLRAIASMLGFPSASTEPGLVVPVTVPALLFRASAPTLTEADLDQLLALVPRHREELVAPFTWRSQTFCPLDPMAATQSGYDLALNVRTSLGLGETEALVGERDLEKILLPKLGILVKDVALTDSRTEGASAYLPGAWPIVAINTAGRFSGKRWGRRMTLAHELCHLLHDGPADGGVGIVSNPWAPSLVERRANAFAAHMLAPPAALVSRLTPDPAHWTADDLGDVMRDLGIGAHTLVRQLQNMRWITEPEAGAWLDTLAAER
jgi:Zn-dependent peptidase ImmA (M78 family)